MNIWLNPTEASARGRGVATTKLGPIGRYATEVTSRPGEPEPTGLEGGCTWMHGHERYRFFCGAAKVVGSSWCAHHHARVYVAGERAP